MAGKEQAPAVWLPDVLLEAKLPHSPPVVTSLIAAGQDGIVMFIGEAVGLFKTESGEFFPFKAATQEDRDSIARMREPIHSYLNNIAVSERGAEIIIENDGEKREIAAPSERLGEPSLSHDLKLVVYIRAKKTPR